MRTSDPRPETAVATLPALELEQPPTPAACAGKTPQEFYAEITRREDVRAILEELADVETGR